MTLLLFTGEAQTGWSAVMATLAVRFGSGAATPAGYAPVRVSTADPPNQLPPTPCIIAFLESGTWRHIQQKRDGTHRAIVRFYLRQVTPGELARDMPLLRGWLDALSHRLEGSVQLGGLVSLAEISDYSIGVLTYADQQYSGIEFGVRLVTNEGWAAVA